LVRLDWMSKLTLRAAVGNDQSGWLIVGKCKTGEIQHHPSLSIHWRVISVSFMVGL
jgi:hypothetical protein